MARSGLYGQWITSLNYLLYIFIHLTNIKILLFIFFCHCMCYFGQSPELYIFFWQKKPRMVYFWGPTSCVCSIFKINSPFNVLFVIVKVFSYVVFESNICNKENVFWTISSQSQDPVISNTIYEIKINYDYFLTIFFR